MNKRGQVTVYVIVGIVIVVSIFLIFYFLGDRIQKQTETEVVFDESSLEPLQDYVGDCITQITDEALDKIGKQGGDISPELYISYNWPEEDYSSNVAYICYTDNFNACINYRPFLAKHVEEELESYIINGLRSCIDLERMRQGGFVVSADLNGMNVDVNIGDYNVITNLDFPITITKGDTSITENRFTKTFDIPLGKLLDVSRDIIDTEIINGVFNADGYLGYSEVVEIYHHKPGDSIIYRIVLTQDRLSNQNYYYFQFAIKNYVSP